MVYKKRMDYSPPFRVRPSLLFLIFLLTLSACAAPSPKLSKNKVFKLGRHRVWLERLNSSDPYLKSRKFSHPSLAGPEVLKKQLRSFQYKGLALLSRKRKVFPDPRTAGTAANLLSKALAQARPDEIVHFDIRQKKGKTTGDLFITGKKVNWRFYTIRGKEYTRHSSGNWLDSWKMILNKDQRYHGARGLFGKSAVENWIVMPLAAAGATHPVPVTKKMAGKRAKASEGKPRTSARRARDKAPEIAPARLERDLARLKRLRTKNLITEKEFQRKKKYLLDRGF